MDTHNQENKATSAKITSVKRREHFLNDDSREIAIAPNAGACFGVVRAIKLAEQSAKRASASNPVYGLGALIHNPQVVDRLERGGIKTVQNAAEIPSGTVILRSHGIQKEVEGTLRSRGVKIVDATCPLVKKPQRLAQSLAEKGYFLVLVGDEKHPETKGVLSYFGTENFLVTYKVEELSRIPDSVTKVGIIAQTTIEFKMLDEVVSTCKQRFPDVIVYNTICDATSVRQSEVDVLAKEADVMLVIGGKNSSNTNKLVKICRDHGCETFLVETFEEINLAWFEKKKKIAITGGASTPQEFVDEVGEKIAHLLN